MRRRLTILALCVGCATAAGAQSAFTERLQQSKAGEGKVTITQDKSIEELVNRPSTPYATKTQADRPQQGSNPANPAKDKPAATPATTASTATDPVSAPDTTVLDNRRKVMKGYKVNGYRVQVFAGGNSRTDRVKAEKTGEDMKSLFPSEPVYVHFYSPRWICRIGNYRTYEEADEVLRSVKKLGYSSAIIVRGKITVQYP